MSAVTVACARCATGNLPSGRFCSRCGLPLGALQADAEAGLDALNLYEAPEPDDPDVSAVLRDLARRSGYEHCAFGPGWRMVVPLPLDRRQAVYVGPVGIDADGRSVLGFVSVSGPATDRDARTLLKLNARMSEGRFAIQVLRGEEYFVVVRLLRADQAAAVDAELLVRRLAQRADGLEDRLSRGRDLY
jgi:hypothetical protein